MTYRPEIDGLRSLALLPVIMHHAGFRLFGGGFVGVDIFFVISGYLITSIILVEKQTETFTLISFYTRRLRRLLPALYFILLISSLVSLFFLSPSDGRDFWQSLSATTFFASNILFFVESSDYFALAAQFKPLLHTWSLAVEEQYYILYPLILLAVWRFGTMRIVALLAAIAVVSLAAAQWMTHNHPGASFYLLPTRAWELLIGAIIAFYLNKKTLSATNDIQNKILYEFGGGVGLVMIALAILLFDEYTPFPSFFSLLPTLGAGLVILFSNPQTVVGRLLSNKFFVSIGLISYSAYLWHQPLFSFTRYYVLAADLSIVQSMIVIALTIGLAALTWKFIEQPFRKKNTVSNHTFFPMFAVLTFALFSLGVAGHLTNGFKNVKLSFIADDRKGIFVDFFSEVDKRKRSWAKIIKSDSFHNDSRKKLLVLGDSMSGDLLHAIALNGELLKTNDIVRQDLRGSSIEAFLVYLMNDGSAEITARAPTISFNTLKRLIADSDEIVLAANWTASTIPSALRLSEYLAKTNKQIYVIDAPQLFHMSASSFYFANSNLPINELNHFMYERLSSNYLSNRDYLNDYFHHQENLNIKLIRKGDFFCDFNYATCAMYSNTGQPLFVDKLHLSIDGLKHFGDRLEKDGYFAR